MPTKYLRTEPQDTCIVEPGVIRERCLTFDRTSPPRPAQSHTGTFWRRKTSACGFCWSRRKIDAQTLLAKAGIDALEREVSDKLQKLILEELHHRIKNTLATVGAIASQSLRNVQGAEHARHAIEGRLLALGRAHDLLLQARWTSAELGKIIRGATEAFDNPDERDSRLPALQFRWHRAPLSRWQ
jgi:HWE histidine kinase